MASSPGKSDHASLPFYIENTVVIAESKAFIMLDKGDFDAMRLDLTIDWTVELGNQSAEESISAVEARINEAVTKYIPIGKTNPSKNKKKPLWMDAFALDKVRKKHYAYIKYSNTYSETTQRKYIKARNQAAKTIRHAQQSYKRNLAQEAKINSRTI